MLGPRSRALPSQEAPSDTRRLFPYDLRSSSPASTLPTFWGVFFRATLFVLSWGVGSPHARAFLPPSCVLPLVASWRSHKTASSPACCPSRPCRPFPLTLGTFRRNSFFSEARRFFFPLFCSVTRWTGSYPLDCKFALFWPTEDHVFFWDVFDAWRYTICCSLRRNGLL